MYRDMNMQEYREGNLFEDKVKTKIQRKNIKSPLQLRKIAQ